MALTGRWSSSNAYEVAQRAPWSDWLLIIGIVVSPMTGLRFAMRTLGPGELLILLWCLVMILSSRYRFRVDTNVIFWTQFVYVIAIGALIGGGVVPERSTPSGLFTWVYFGFVSVVVFGTLKRRPLPELERLLYRIGLVGSTWYLALLALATAGGHSILGAPLWYGPRFSGGATNPHQIALLCAALVFINLRSAYLSKTLFGRMAFLLAGAAAVMVGVATAASTWILAVMVTALVAPALYLFSVTKSHRLQMAAIFGTAALALAIWMVKSDAIIMLMNDFVDADPNGRGRLEIASHISKTFALSPFFGLGPGSHSDGPIGSMEYHNSYLEVLAMAGGIGLVLFLGYTVWMLTKIAVSPTLLTIVLPLMVYGLGGFAARRLPYWTLFMLVLAIAYRVSNPGNKYCESARSPGEVPQSS